MVGELIQGALNEFRDENDASDPIATLGRFVGRGFELEALNETLEIAGDMGGGLDGFIQDATPAPGAAPTVKTTIDPAFASGPSFGNSPT